MTQGTSSSAGPDPGLASLAMELARYSPVGEVFTRMSSLLAQQVPLAGAAVLMRSYVGNGSRWLCLQQTSQGGIRRLNARGTRMPTLDLEGQGTGRTVSIASPSLVSTLAPDMHGLQGLVAPLVAPLDDIVVVAWFPASASAVRSRQLFDVLAPAIELAALRAGELRSQRRRRAARQARHRRRSSSPVDKISNEVNPVVKFSLYRPEASSPESARDRAERASEAKSRFLAMMSHEMRTPLNAILGMTELVLDSQLDGEQRQYLETVHDSAEVLLRLIDDLLDVSRVEAGEITFDDQPFDLQQVTRSVVAMLAPKAQQKGLKLTGEVDRALPRVVGDANRFRQILMNLAGNAVKFTHEGSVTIDVRPSERSAPSPASSAFTITVSDTGIGIPEEQVERVFERFYQVDSTSRRAFGGTGLGLAVTRSLVEQMGGSVSVASRVNAGTSFRVELCLPIDDQPRRPESTAQFLAPNVTGRVLVVEDNAENRFLVERLLDRMGLEPDLAQDGLEAVRRARERRYDVILMDLELPHLDGLETTQRIHEHERRNGLKLTPVVALTAHTVPAFRARCQQAGMVGFLEKPVNRQRLLEVIARFLTPGCRPILVVDDADEMRLLLSRYLEREGFEVVTAASVQEALELMSEAGVALEAALVDLDLPDGTGQEVLGRLRQRDEHIPVMALTGHGDAATRLACDNAGFTDTLVKPVARAPLVRRLRAHLERRSQR